MSNKLLQVELELMLRRICPSYFTFTFDEWEKGESWESWEVRFMVGNAQIAALRLGWASEVAGAFVGENMLSLTRTNLEHCIQERIDKCGVTLKAKKK